MRRQIGVHPFDHVTFLDIKGVLVVVALEYHLGEDTVDLHHAERAADLHAAVFYFQFGIGGAFSRLNFLNIPLERQCAVGDGGNPDAIAVQITHDAHVSAVGKRVLGYEISVFVDCRTVDHVSWHETARIGAAEKDRILSHFQRELRIRKRLFFRGQLLVYCVGATQLVVAELPAEIMAGHFSAANHSNALLIERILVKREQHKSHGSPYGKPFKNGIALEDDVIEEGEPHDDAVANPERIKCV